MRQARMPTHLKAPKTSRTHRPSMSSTPVQGSKFGFWPQSGSAVRQVATGSTGIRSSIAFLSPTARIFSQVGFRAPRDASRPSSGVHSPLFALRSASGPTSDRAINVAHLRVPSSQYRMTGVADRHIGQPPDRNPFDPCCCGNSCTTLERAAVDVERHDPVRERSLQHFL